MKNLPGSVRTYLRGLAHHLKPAILIGQNGLTPAQFHEINVALDQYELIKIRFNSFKEQKKELTAQIAEETGSELLGIIGNIAILYRQQPDPEKRVIELPVKS